MESGDKKKAQQSPDDNEDLTESRLEGELDSLNDDLQKAPPKYFYLLPRVAILIVARSYSV